MYEWMYINSQGDHLTLPERARPLSHPMNVPDLLPLLGSLGLDGGRRLAEALVTAVELATEPTACNNIPFLSLPLSLPLSFFLLFFPAALSTDDDETG